MKHFRLRPVLTGCLVSSFVFQFESGASAQELLLLPSAGLLLMGEDLEERERGPASMWLRSPRRPSALLPRHFPGQHLAQDPPPPQHPQSTRPWYRHMSSTDNWKQGDFWYTDRDNIFGQTAVDAWDPLRLINTDRPDFTDVATVVGDGRVQLETGFLRVVRQEGDVRTKIDSGPNALLRVGVGDSFEWRVKYRGYLHYKVTDTAGDSGTLNGMSDIELGFKWVLQEQEDLLPMQSLVVRCNVPIGSDEVSANRLEPGLTYIYNWQVRRWWFFRGATGVDVFNQPAPNFLPQGGGLDGPRDHWLDLSQAVSSYFQVSKRVGCFVEWFMFSRHGSLDDHSDHFHNYGLYFWGAGVSMRF
jgi:hypothetical protein